jgi:dephospho-CoA kinase
VFLVSDLLFFNVGNRIRNQKKLPTLCRLKTKFYLPEIRMDRMQIGLTGGIGSGKTTVARLFELLGIPVYYADDRAKALMEEDPEVRQGLLELFGPEVYLPSGQLNRAWISQQVFSNRNLLEKLEKIVHPAVFLDGNQWHQEQNAPYTIKEAALLFESGSAEQLDRIIVVTAPDQLRIQRVIERDQVTAEQVQSRMNNQWPQSEKAERADYVIQNDGAHLLIPQVWSIHQEILQEIKKYHDTK